LILSVELNLYFVDNPGNFCTDDVNRASRARGSAGTFEDAFNEGTLLL
jgi:hypothetical protein